MANTFIETITSMDGNISVIATSHTPHYYPDDKNLHDGSVRTKQGGLEYYDVNFGCWLPLPGADVKVELSPQIEYVLKWAFKKMAEEEKLNELAKQYPAFKQAKDNYDLIKAMVDNE